MNNKILILGSEGFLGTIVVQKLIKSKKFKNITGVDICLFGKYNNKFKSFKLLRTDYSKLNKNFLSKFDYIIDLANVSNDPSSEIDPNFTKNNNYNNKIKFYRKLKKVKNYIYASSCSVYGMNKNLVNENSKLSPISVYSKSCLKFENFLKKNYLPFTILRFGTLFGWSKRMRYDIAINKIIRDACYNKSIEVLGGSQYRYFCFNETAADIIIDAISGSTIYNNRILNIGNFNIKIINLAKKIYSYFGKNVNFRHERFNVDHRSYKVSTLTISKINKKYLSKYYIDKAIKKTIKKIKKDKKPFDRNKITLNAYSDLINKKIK